MLQFLVKQGFLLENTIRHSNGHALCVAAITGDVELLLLLVECGADMMVYGRTAMEISAKHDHLNVFKYLMSARIDTAPFLEDSNNGEEVAQWCKGYRAAIWERDSVQPLKEMMMKKVFRL